MMRAFTFVPLLLAVLLGGCDPSRYAAGCEEDRPCIPEDKDGHPLLGICSQGKTRCSLDGKGRCDQTIMPREEICNGEDDNCNGRIDEGYPYKWYDDEQKMWLEVEVRDKNGAPNVCYDSQGACRRRGTVNCRDDNKKGVSYCKVNDPIDPKILPSNEFHAEPYVHPDVVEGFDWNCDGRIYRRGNCGNFSCNYFEIGEPCVSSSQQVSNVCNRASSYDSCSNGPIYCGNCGDVLRVGRCQWFAAASQCNVSQDPFETYTSKVSCL